MGRVVGSGVERVELLVQLIGDDDVFEVVDDASAELAVEIAA
jgi:hypothetical protein